MGQRAVAVVGPARTRPERRASAAKAIAADGLRTPPADQHREREAARERERGHVGHRGYAVTLSGLPWLPSMNGLHGFARTGPFVFHTTLNWPSPFTSPMNTGLVR